MRRILIIGAKIPPMPSIEWAECATHNIQDYQGLLFDCRRIWEVPDQGKLSGILYPYLCAGHTAYVILPEAKEIRDQGTDLTLIPYLLLRLSKVKGSTLKFVSSDPQFQIFKEYLECLSGHEVIIEHKNAPAPWVWENAIINNVTQAVSGKYGNVFVFHPPLRQREQRAFQLIIKHFSPDPVEPEPDPQPDWAEQILSSIPGMTEIAARLGDLNHQISGLEANVAAETDKQRLLQRWVELLWLDGIALEHRVHEALSFLGLVVEAPQPSGHTRDLVIRHGHTAFLVEVAGSSGSINVDKGRQLLQWVGESEDPLLSKGVLIANAYRKEPPENRPPSPSHKVFVTELEQLAKKFHFALIDVRDIFNLIQRKLRGETVDPNIICEHMTGDGIVRL